MKPYSQKDSGSRYAQKPKGNLHKTDQKRAEKKRARQQSQLLVKSEIIPVS